eukprot:1713699-Alexandrium_andersonii.AAC.1
MSIRSGPPVVTHMQGVGVREHTPGRVSALGQGQSNAWTVQCCHLTASALLGVDVFALILIGMANR